MFLESSDCPLGGLNCNTVSPANRKGFVDDAAGISKLVNNFAYANTAFNLCDTITHDGQVSDSVAHVRASSQLLSYCLRHQTTGGPLLLRFSSDRWRSYRPMLEALDLSFLIAGAIFRASGNTVFQRTNKWQMSVREELLLTFQPDIKRML